MTTQINPGELFAVKGMVALVTGGGTGNLNHLVTRHILTTKLTFPSGIGLMMAKALTDAGASKVYIVGRRKEALDAAAKQINKPDVVVPLVGDVSSRSSLSSIASSITDDTGYLNLVVCNAGISGPQGGMPGPETTLEEWQQKQLSFDPEEYTKTFNVNSTSVWYTAMSMLKLLDEGNKKGNLKQTSQIVVTSSIASFNKIAPGGWAYGQSKAAATLASKQLSVVLSQWDIRCNCICPGCKCTPSLER